MPCTQIQTHLQQDLHVGHFSEKEMKIKGNVIHKNTIYKGISSWDVALWALPVSSSIVQVLHQRGRFSDTNLTSDKHLAYILTTAHLQSWPFHRSITSLLPWRRLEQLVQTGAYDNETTSKPTLPHLQVHLALSVQKNWATMLRNSEFFELISGTHNGHCISQWRWK